MIERVFSEVSTTTSNAPVRVPLYLSGTQQKNKAKAGIKWDQFLLLSSQGQSATYYQNLKLLLRDIEELMRSDEYDDDFLIPTKYAVNQAKEWLDRAAKIRLDFPVGGKVSTDGSGSLRIRWISRDKEVCLVSSADPYKKSYIYYENDSDYDAELDVTPDAIANKIAWLIS